MPSPATGPVLLTDCGYMTDKTRVRQELYLSKRLVGGQDAGPLRHGHFQLRGKQARAPAALL